MNNKKFVMLLMFLLLITSVNAFDLTSSEREKSVCPSSTILLNANVFGTGNFNINVEGTAAKWTVAVPQGFTLNNEAKTIYIYVTPKFDTSPGNYNLNLVVTGNNEVKQINYKINVPDCHNLVVTGTQGKEICGCNSDVYNFTISNNGIYQESYKIEVNGKAAPWISLNQDTLTLLPGQSKAIYGILNTPCGSDFGENDFTVSVRSLTSNTVASFDSNVIVNSCFDFETTLEKELVNMCEHSSEVIPLAINNLAQLDNEFELSITGPAWASLSLNKLNLKSKTSGVVNLVFTPDYKVEGNFDVNVNIKSKQSKISKDVKVKVSVRKCNDVSFELLQREDKICLGAKKIYEANIKNIGELEKEFRIESNQGWVKVDPVILTLGAGQSRSIKIEFDPGENITAQKYDLKFKALALDSSKISSEDDFSLHVVSRDQCYMPELEVKDLEVNADSSATTPIIIKNIGIELAVYELGLSGNANSFSQLNPSIVTIQPGKTEIVYLYVAPPYNIKPGEYKADILLSLKNSGVLESKVININVKEAKEVPGITQVSDLWQRLLNLFKRFSQPLQQQEKLINLDRENIIKTDVKFELGNETHSLKIFEVKNNSVTLVIESDPVFVLLDLNETEEVDLDKDGKTDLILELQGFDNGEPLIKVSKPSEASEEKEETPPATTNYLQNLKDKIYQYRIVLLIGVIFVIGLVLFFTTGTYKKLVKYIEEDEEEEEPLKVGRWILLAIILIVLYWYFRNYSSKLSFILNFLNVYKFYIIAGLFILILLILIINYWKQIVDFFEEDTGVRKRRR